MFPLRSVSTYAALGLTAAVGGAAAVGAVALLGGFEDGTTTVTETSAAARTEPAPMTDGEALSVNEIYERAAPGVVQVTSTNRDIDTSAGSAPPALGSGFVVDKAGHIVTNYHVVQGGDRVVAIGNPFGLDRTATAGIVSALQRLIRAPNRFTIDHVIQTDAPINRGNSGGPLLDDRGEVIGVNTQIETGGIGATGNVGIGFAVPSNTVKDVVAQLLRTGYVEHTWLGINGKPVTDDVADSFNLPVDDGVLVEKVWPNSGAAKAGLKAGDMEVVVAGETYNLGGDIIVSVNGKKISEVEEIRDVIAGRKPGEEIKLGIVRDEKQSSVTVTLGRQPSSPQG